VLQKKNKSNRSTRSHSSDQPRIINKSVPPYREIRLFPKHQLILTDFDFQGFINDVFGSAVNKKLSNTRYADFEDLYTREEEKGWSFYNVQYTHALANWQVDNRLLVFCRALINGHEFTIAQWESNFIFIKDSEAFDAIYNEGTLSPMNFLKGLQ